MKRAQSIGSLKASLLFGRSRPPPGLPLMGGEEIQLVGLAVKLLGKSTEFLLGKEVEAIASRLAAA